MKKLFVYPSANDMIHDATEGLENTIPFCKAGIEKNFDVVTEPSEADYFFMGQVADKNVWQLHPNRFEFFKGNEHRHIIDLEGDWRDYEHPEWLKDSLIITGHARLDSVGVFNRRFVRPVISPLLVRLVRNRPEYELPVKRGFWFQGQRDSRGLREKVRQAVALTGLPYDYKYNDRWGVFLDSGHSLVKEYLEKACIWSHALCPVGEGPACRYYEMALLGRPAVLIGDYEVFNERSVLSAYNFPIRIRTNESLELIASKLKEIYDGHNEANDISAAVAYGAELQRYFDDPTTYYMNWLASQSG